jgi:hypothetical protein
MTMLEEAVGDVSGNGVYSLSGATRQENENE